MTTELLYYVLKSLTDRDSIKLSDMSSKNDFFYFYQDKPYSIDLHRLVHLCKVFAQSHKCNLGSGYDNEYGWYAFYSIDSITDEAVYIIADTEPEAVFEATQFIIDTLFKGK